MASVAFGASSARSRTLRRIGKRALVALAAVGLFVGPAVAGAQTALDNTTVSCTTSTCSASWDATTVQNSAGEVQYRYRPTASAAWVETQATSASFTPTAGTTSGTFSVQYQNSANAWVGTDTAIWGLLASMAGDGTVQEASIFGPDNILSKITDYGIENSPTIVGIIGAIFLLGLTFMLIRRGLGRVKGIFGKV